MVTPKSGFSNSWIDKLLNNYFIAKFQTLAPRRVVKYSYSNAVSVASIVGTVTVPLDIVEGDTSFSNLNANQITLQAGTYKFTGAFRNYVSGLSYISVYDIVNNTEIVRSSVSYGNSTLSVSNSLLDSILIKISSPVTVELRNTSTLARGNGIASSTDPSNFIFNYLVIEKIK